VSGFIADPAPKGAGHGVLDTDTVANDALSVSAIIGQVANVGHALAVGGPNDAPKVGLGVDTFVFAPNSGHDTNTLLDAIQHPQTALADLHAVADIVSTHDAGSTTTLTDVHASNLHADAFHLV
jgi:hypothetical protein